MSHMAILLDTSFILPAYGVDVGEEAEQCLRMLKDHEDKLTIYYSSFNLLEALLVLVREARRGGIGWSEAEQLALRGSIAVATMLSRISEPPAAYSRAIALYGMGHRDMFDNILYALATLNNVKLLTLDRELEEFIVEHGLENPIITPSTLKELLSNHSNNT